MHGDGHMLWRMNGWTGLGQRSSGDGAKTGDSRQKKTAAHAFPPFSLVIAGEAVCGKIQDLDKDSPELDKGYRALLPNT